MEQKNINEKIQKETLEIKKEGQKIICPHCGEADTQRYNIEGEDDMIECNICGLVFIPNESGLLDRQFLTIKGHADCEASCCEPDEQEAFMNGGYEGYSEYEVLSL